MHESRGMREVTQVKKKIDIQYKNVDKIQSTRSGPFFSGSLIIIRIYSAFFFVYAGNNFLR